MVFFLREGEKKNNSFKNMAYLQKVAELNKIDYKVWIIHMAYNSIEWGEEHTDSFLSLLNWGHNVMNEESLVVRRLGTKCW